MPKYKVAYFTAIYDLRCRAASRSGTRESKRDGTDELLRRVPCTSTGIRTMNRVETSTRHPVQERFFRNGFIVGCPRKLGRQAPPACFLSRTLLNRPLANQQAVRDRRRLAASGWLALCRRNVFRGCCRGSICRRNRGYSDRGSLPSLAGIRSGRRPLASDQVTTAYGQAPGSQIRCKRRTMTISID